MLSLKRNSLRFRQLKHYSTVPNSVPLYIAGKSVKGSDSFVVNSPWNNSPIYNAESASVEQAKAAAQAASEHGIVWADWKPAQRRATLLKAANVSSFLITY